jgi:phosphohistidine phosphatase SixA
MRDWRFHLGAAMLMAMCSAIPASVPAIAQASAGQPSADTKELLAKIKEGGYVVYLRHTETDSATKDTDLSDMSNCATQRVLSGEGREHAKKLGEAVAALKIPVGTVITSRFCRAKETAKLMGFTETRELGDLDNDSGEPLVAKDESQRRAAALRKLLGTPAAEGKNTLIVGHVPNMREAVSLDYAKMKEGEIAVFAPKAGDPAYDEVGRILPVELLSAASSAGN